MSEGEKRDAERNGTGVVFSSGFFGFFAHAGFLAALRESGLQPEGYAGASSGAIVAAMAACDMPDDEIRGILFNIRKKDFWDPDSPGLVLFNMLKGFRGWTGYLRGEKFAELLKKIPARRIEDCAVPLVIAATDLTFGKEVIMTKGDLAQAVHASGAVPGLFKPVRIKGSWCVDGGIADKAPVRALTEAIQPARILVHLISSENLAANPGGFLAKRFSFWHIHSMSINIARKLSYEHQCELVRSRGIEVVEIRTDPPSLGPDSLSAGISAYAHARKETLRFLSAYEKC